ncbi:MAG: hypothetical protein AB1599_08270 [Planctomycetota bacterium]
MSTMKDDDYFNWQGKVVNKAVANQVAWNLPAAKVTALVARRAWYEPLYHKAQEKDERTKADVDRHRQARKLYEGELRAFINAHIRYNDDVPRDEKIAMGVPPRDLEPTPRGKIETKPYIDLEPAGGGSIKVRCRETTDRTRASRHPLADGIECRYTFVPVGEMAPENWDDCPKTVVSKKALFKIQCGAKVIGQRFYGFFRWVNLTNPANNGDWTESKHVVIA